MTWGDFQTQVKELLTVDAQRTGSGAPDFVNRQIRAAVIDIQRNIRAYRVGHETLYEPNDLKAWGEASLGTLPWKAKVREVRMMRQQLGVCECEWREADSYDWEKRYNLITGQACLNAGWPLCAINPDGTTFIVAPQLHPASTAADATEEEATSYKLSVVWDGVRDLWFSNQEQTPFDEPMVYVAGDFVKGECCRHFREDLESWKSFQATYLIGRRKLRLDSLDKARKG